MQAQFVWQAELRDPQVALLKMFIARTGIEMASLIRNLNQEI